jgi:hypothetical protein
LARKRSYDNPRISKKVFARFSGVLMNLNFVVRARRRTGARAYPWVGGAVMNVERSQAVQSMLFTSALMCQNVPPRRAAMCQNVPPQVRRALRDVPEHAETCLNMPDCREMSQAREKAQNEQNEPIH